ncbi:MAG: DUF6465 family protein [Acutalibacteraceae bacterium]|nr:DUF6465 family protein [Acutalibacteraceae bacterium]
MATTKKTAPEAAKTETAKVEAVKAEEAVETVTAADTKAEEVAAAPAKETKAPAKKTTKKAAAKKTTTKKAAKKEEAAEVAAPAATTEIFVEYNGVQVSGEEIVRLVKGSYGKDVTDLKIYVKPEDNRAYYVADGEAGSVRVLFI